MNRRIASLLGLVCLAALAAGLYWKGVRGEFLGADHALFSRSPLTALPSAGGSGAGLPDWLPRATSVLSLAADRLAWGPLPAGFRTTNLLLHVLTTLLLFALCRRWTGRFAESFAAAMLFAVHPVHVAAVEVAGARGEILATLFVLLALTLFDRVALALVCYVIATLASPLALVLPLVIFMCDPATLAGRERAAAPVVPPPRTDRSRIWALFAAASLPSILTSLALAPPAAPVDRLLAGRAILTSFRLLVFPFPLRVQRILDSPVGGAIVSVLALLGALVLVAGLVVLARILAAAGRVRTTGAAGEPIARITLLALMLALLPVLALAIFPPTAPGPDVAFTLLESFLYLPSAGACIVLVAAIGFLAGLAGAASPASRSRATWLIAAALTVPFAILTLARLSVYQNDVTYYAAAAGEAPGSEHLRVQLARAAAAHGDPVRAIEILEPVLARRPDAAELHLLAGNLYRDGRDLDSAEKETREALRIDPAQARAYVTLGLISRERGDARGAETNYREAIRLDPGLAEAHSNLGAVLVALGAPDQALAEMKRAVELDPSLSDAAANLANFLLEQKQPAAALEVLDRALALSGSDARLHYSLGVVLQRQGDNSRAIAEYEAAIRLDPTYARPKNNLATLYVKQKRYEEAIELLRQLIALEPRNEQAHFNLGFVYKEKGDTKLAAAEFTEALKIRPTYAEASRALSEMFNPGGTPHEP